MDSIINKGTRILIFIAILIIAISMIDNKYPRFNINEWWILLWAYSPYAAFFVLYKFISIKRPILLFVGALMFLVITTLILLDSLYLHKDAANPEGLLVYLFLPVVQLGLIFAIMLFDVSINVLKYIRSKFFLENGRDQ